MGTSQRKEVSAEFINRSPGPTQYNVNLNEMEKKNISLKYKLNYPIDYNLRIDKERPGPGYYENNVSYHFKT